MKQENGKYILCEFCKPDVSEYKAKIHIYGKRDLNDNFRQKESSLSATWLRNSRYSEEIKTIKKNIYNFFTNKEPARGENIMWTTFKDCRGKLEGKGYTRRFVAHNCRATNDYSDTTHLCYALNKYPDVGISQFFSQHGIVIDQDRYALAEMLQWIWRSNIRCGGEIWIYIPSKRMRNLLLDWLENRYQ